MHGIFGDFISRLYCFEPTRAPRFAIGRHLNIHRRIIMTRRNRVTSRITLCASLALVAVMATAVPLKPAAAESDWNNGQWHNKQHRDRYWGGGEYGNGYENNYGNSYGNGYGGGGYYSNPAPTYYYGQQPTYYYQQAPTYYYQPRPVYTQPGFSLNFN